MEFCQFAAKFYTAMDNITSRSVAAVKDGSTRKPLRQVFLLAALFPLLLSCDGIFPSGQGTLRIKLSSESGISSGSKSQTSLSPVPDTEDFVLSITDSNGKSIYKGRFGDSPESYELKAGNYTVAAASLEFDSPAFDEPCFSDSRMIMLKDGQELFVELNCIQSNCGIALESDATFRAAFPSGKLILGSDSGSLEYGYDNSGYAFFPPGRIAVSLEHDGESEALFSRRLEAGNMLRVKLSASSDITPGYIGIKVDSSRVWNSEEYIYGDGSGNAGDIDHAYSVTEAADNAPRKDVWVLGYIVGVATNTNKFSFEAPFSKNTNLLLGLRSSSTAPEYLLCVELKAGDVREELNLMDNPGIKGRQIYMKGDLVSSYYGIPGLKNVSEFQFKP